FPDLSERAAMSVQAVPLSLHEKTGHTAPPPLPPLGYVDWDGSAASNERVTMRSPLVNRDRIIRDQYVRIEDPLGSRSGFLGRIVAGPFFSQRLPGVNGSHTAGSGEISI